VIGTEQATYLASLMVVVYVERSRTFWLPATDVAATIILFKHSFVVSNINAVHTDARDALLFVSLISISRHT